MTKSIYLSDLNRLVQVLTGQECQPLIFDPNNRLVQDVEQPVTPCEPQHMVLVSLAESVHSYRGMALDHFDVVIDFGRGLDQAQLTQQTYRVINNSDGSMRWLFPKGQLPRALDLYNEGSLRAKLLGWGLRTASAMGLERLVCQATVRVYAQQPVLLEKELAPLEPESLTIFTGTPGLHRTPVIGVLKGQQTAAFAKVALDGAGAAQLSNERRQLQRLSNQNWTSFSVPQLLPARSNRLLLTANVRPAQGQRPRSIGQQQTAALLELAQDQLTRMPLCQTTWWENALTYLANLNRLDTPASFQLSIALLTRLKDQLDGGALVLSSRAHGDFTPWNQFEDQDGLALYDWEMALNSAPVGYDLFHFCAQQGALVSKGTATSVTATIKQALAQSAWKAFADQYQLDWDQQFRYYLMMMVAKGLLACAKQPLSTGQEQQVQLWEQLLQQHVSPHSAPTHRLAFLEDLQLTLPNYQYALVKFTHDQLTDLAPGSDLDMVITKDGQAALIQFGTAHPLVARANCSTTSYMAVVELFFKDGTFLSLDLITQIKHKATTLMATQPLLESAQPNVNGLQLPALQYDLEYCLLFYNQNGAGIPLKYYRHFDQYAENQKRVALAYLNDKYQLRLERFSQLFQSGAHSQATISRMVRQQAFNAWPMQIMDGVRYGLDLVRRVAGRPGYLITFSGVDGAGKSTVIELVRERLEQTYRKEVVLKRHRPGLLPMLNALRVGHQKAEELATTQLPRQGKNTSTLGSAVRFGYYFLDYLLGQVVVHFRYTLRGKVVLYDRYYFDFINDSARSNIRLNSGLVKWLYRFIAKPRLNIFLYADPAVILARKQEMEGPEIIQLTQAYQALFAEMATTHKGAYHAIENLHLDQTVDSIVQQYTKIA